MSNIQQSSRDTGTLVCWNLSQYLFVDHSSQPDSYGGTCPSSLLASSHGKRASALSRLLQLHLVSSTTLCEGTVRKSFPEWPWWRVCYYAIQHGTGSLIQQHSSSRRLVHQDSSSGRNSSLRWIRQKQRSSSSFHD